MNLSAIAIGPPHCDADRARVAASSRTEYSADPRHISVKHLRENLQAAALQLSPETIAKLDSIAAASKQLTTNMKKTTNGIGLVTGANKSIGHAGHTRVRERQLAPCRLTA